MRRQLVKLRSGINKIDAKIVRLLNKRIKIVIKIGHLKKACGIQVYDPKREEAVLKRVRAIASRGPLGPKAVEKIFKLVIKISTSIEKGGTK